MSEPRDIAAETAIQMLGEHDSDKSGASFIGRLAMNSGMPYRFFRSKSVGSLVEKYSAYGRFWSKATHEPKTGDLIVCDENGQRMIGLVYAANETEITVIGVDRHCRVNFAEKKRNSPEIQGFCIPNYK